MTLDYSNVFYQSRSIGIVKSEMMYGVHRCRRNVCLNDVWLNIALTKGGGWAGWEIRRVDFGKQ